MPLSYILLICTQHVLDKNSVPSRRVIHQHMRNCPYQLPILNDGTPAHG